MPLSIGVITDSASQLDFSVGIAVVLCSTFEVDVLFNACLSLWDLYNALLMELLFNPSTEFCSSFSLLVIWFSLK